MSDRDGKNAVQLTRLQSGNSSAPYWSPDGEWITFQSAGENDRDIYVIRASGGEPQRLTDHPARDMQPTVSRDGRWIYFSSNRSGEYGIWKIAPEGGEPVQLTDGGEAYAIESLDGRTLYMSTDASLWSMPSAGGQRTLEIERFRTSMNWAVGRSGIYFTHRENTPPTIDFFDFRDKTVRPVAEIEEDTYTGFSVSPDGESILYTLGSPAQGDILYTDGFR